MLRDGKLPRFMSSSTARKAGAGSSGSSLASKRARKDRTPLHRHQSEQTRRSGGSTRTSIAGAARQKTISSPGRPIWRRIARLLQGDSEPVSAVPACGRATAMWGPRGRCQSARCGESPSSDTLRLCLIKIAACVVEMKTMIRVHLPTSCPLRISGASLWDAYRASSHDRMGMRPQTSTDVPSTRKPSFLRLLLRRKPTSRGPTYAKFRKITRIRPSRARNSSKRCIKRAILKLD